MQAFQWPFEMTQILPRVAQSILAANGWSFDACDHDIGVFAQSLGVSLHVNSLTEPFTAFQFCEDSSWLRRRSSKFFQLSSDHSENYIAAPGNGDCKCSQFDNSMLGGILFDSSFSGSLFLVIQKCFNFLQQFLNMLQVSNMGPVMTGEGFACFPIVFLQTCVDLAKKFLDVRLRVFVCFQRIGCGFHFNLLSDSCLDYSIHNQASQGLPA